VLLPEPQAEAALALLQRFQPQARRIGTVLGPLSRASPLERLHPVCLRGELGVRRPLELGSGEQLPRIC